jgi:hypothetical protein
VLPAALVFRYFPQLFQANAGRLLIIHYYIPSNTPFLPHFTADLAAFVEG